MFGALSEDQQKTLRLHFIEGYTLDEIATTLGQTKRYIGTTCSAGWSDCEN